MQQLWLDNAMYLHSCSKANYEINKFLFTNLHF